MRIANHEGRLVIVIGELAHDVEKNSSGRFGPDPQAVYEEWDAFTSWAVSARLEGGAPIRPEGLGSPVPAPRQVFGIGLNYRDHAAESNLELPTEHAVVFAKFPASVTGPFAEVKLPSGAVDFEAELVVVIGRGGQRIRREDARSEE